MTPDTGTFDLHRSLPLPAERLWQAIVNAEERGLWDAPAPDMEMTVEAADPRVGGLEKLHYSPKTPSAEMPDFTAHTRWYHLTAPARAVFTETVLIEGEALFTSLVTMVLTPSGSGTDLDITVATASFAGAEALAEVQSGWEGGMSNLDRYVSEIMG